MNQKKLFPEIKDMLQTLLGAILLIMTACSNPAKTPDATFPASTQVPPSPTVVGSLPASSLSDVPRNQTLVLGWPLDTLVGVTNPWAVLSYTHQDGNTLLWEGLYYFGIFSDRDIPWLAESMEYNDDFTQLTIKLNKAAAWSDGEPLTSKDVIFTFDGQMNNELLIYHADFQKFVRDYSAPDERTVIVNFKVPAPHFKFDVLTLKFDTGINILPEHVLRGQADVTGFEGGPQIPHSGPYDIVLWQQDRKVFDLRPDWWAVKAGLIQEPAVKRVIFLSISNDSTEIAAMRTVNNEFDATLDMRSTVIASVLRQNPKITTHTGNAPPYGYVDWWPNSLWVNTLLPPYDDVRVRRAISLAIDRYKINEVLYGGAKIATIYPFPLYPGLQKFLESPEVKALEARYEPGRFDLEECARLMTKAGFTKNTDGFWARDGETLDATVSGFAELHGDIAPLLAEMLRQGGFDSSTYFGSDVFDRLSKGEPGLYLFGHGASLKDPFATFELFHSRHSLPTGSPNGIYYFSRYNNPEYDQVVDAMAVSSTTDPKFHELAVQAMEVYWREVIDIPVIQWLHRIPYNQTYWINWPTQDNLAMGTNGAFWAHTGMLVITNLQQSKK